jgi:hypothetical protein
MMNTTTTAFPPPPQEANLPANVEYITPDTGTSFSSASIAAVSIPEGADVYRSGFPSTQGGYNAPFVSVCTSALNGISSIAKIQSF